MGPPLVLFSIEPLHRHKGSAHAAFDQSGIATTQSRPEDALGWRRGESLG
jgi:hypothetical protein